MAVVCVLQCKVSVGIRVRQPKMLPPITKLNYGLDRFLEWERIDGQNYVFYERVCRIHFWTMAHLLDTEVTLADLFV